MQIVTARNHRTPARECYLNTIIFCRVFSGRGKPSVPGEQLGKTAFGSVSGTRHRVSTQQDIHLYTAVAFACCDLIMQ